MPSGRCWPLSPDHVPFTRLIHSANVYSDFSKQRQFGVWSFSREKNCTASDFMELVRRFPRQLGHQLSTTDGYNVEGLVSCSPGSLQNSNMNFPSHPTLVSQLICHRVEPRVAKMSQELPKYSCCELSVHGFVYPLQELFPLLTSGEHVHSSENRGLLIKRNTYLLV